MDRSRVCTLAGEGGSGRPAGAAAVESFCSRPTSLTPLRAVVAVGFMLVIE